MDAIWGMVSKMRGRASMRPEWRLLDGAEFRNLDADPRATRASKVRRAKRMRAERRVGKRVTVSLTALWSICSLRAHMRRTMEARTTFDIRASCANRMFRGLGSGSSGAHSPFVKLWMLDNGGSR